MPVKLFFTLLATYFFTIGCSEMDPASNKITKYKIPWQQNGQNTSFRVVTIDDLNNPYEMSGASAIVIARGDYSGSLGPQGAISKPNMTREGDVLIPNDTLSIASVSAYAHMNRLRKLDEKLGVKSFLKWPRTIGVNTYRPLGNNYYASDNAFYSMKNDTINLLPYSQQGLPLHINGNVIAHEHFHALFSSQVNWRKHHSKSKMFEKGSEDKRPIAICEKDKFYTNVFSKLSQSKNRSLRRIIGKLNKESVTKLAHQANYIVARAWDEGSADFYSYLYIKNPKFFQDSYPGRGYFRNIKNYPKNHFRSTRAMVLKLGILNRYRCKKNLRNSQQFKFLSFGDEVSYYYLVGSDYTKFLVALSQSKALQKNMENKHNKN